VTRPDAKRRTMNTGRIRKLSGARLELAREWYRSRRTRRQKADELGLTVWLFQHIIHRRGHYKLPSPELRDEVLRRRRALMDRLRREGVI